MEAILDLSIVNAIRELGDHRENDTLLQELFDIFCTQADSGRAALRAAVEAEDYNKLRSSAHKLKGSAANLGAAYLASRCQVLEQIGKEGVADPVVLRQALTQVESAIDSSLASLTREIRGH